MSENSNPQAIFGRPDSTTRNLPQDQNYTEEVVLQLLAILNYTSIAGLQSGFFTRIDDGKFDNVSNEVLFDEDLHVQDQEWLSNMIVRMRYSMTLQAADEFQKLIKETYLTLRVNIRVSVRVLVAHLQTIINSSPQEYPFLLLKHSNLARQHRIDRFNDKSLSTLLTEIVLSVRQSILKKGSMRPFRT